MGLGNHTSKTEGVPDNARVRDQGYRTPFVVFEIDVLVMLALRVEGKAREKCCEDLVAGIVDWSW